ncbi:MAG: glycosyltransferase [Rubrivivax sp.]|nr:glycosyltransferase [Rubrivivax sp.]
MSDTLLLFGDASSVHTRRWVHEMTARGLHCVVATRRPAVLADAEVVALRPGADALGWFAALPAVRALARRLRPRWVHGHYVTSYGLWAAACRDIAPVVLTAWGSDLLVTPRERGWRGRLMHALVGRTLRRASLVTADSRDLLQAARAYGTPARCEEVSWGADTDRFVPGTPAPGFEVVSLRAWEPNYRIETVLRAFATFVRRHPQVQAVLHLLGGGPDEARLRGEASHLGIADRVRFTGRVGDDEMVATLQRCRVSISVPDSDATSVSVLESMACGLPVVASDLPSNRQWLDRELLVPRGDAGALAAALARLHDDPGWAAAQGRRNRARVLEHASRRDEMDRMLALYRTVTAGERR